MRLRHSNLPILWKGQFGAEPIDLAHRADNLHAPLRRDFGAHGRFDKKAKATSLQYRLGANPRRLAYLAAAGIAFLVYREFRRAMGEPRRGS